MRLLPAWALRKWAVAGFGILPPVSRCFALLWLTIAYRTALLERQGQRRLVGLWPGNRIAMAPDRARPGRIALVAADHMDMQLGDDVAQVADIDFLDAGQRTHQTGKLHDLLHHLGLIVGGKVRHLDHARPARHQKAPV